MATHNEKKYYTILFVPGGSEKTVSLHVYRHIVYSFVLFVIVFFIGFTGLVIKSGEIASKLHRVSALNNENRKLKAENLKPTMESAMNATGPTHAFSQIGSCLPAFDSADKATDKGTLALPSKATIDAAELRRNPPKLLNFKELCVFLDISARHGRHLIAERKLPAIRLGDRLLFDTAKILTALERLAV